MNRCVDNQCHCDCGLLHTHVEKYIKTVVNAAFERSRGNHNHGQYVGIICAQTVAVMARDLCDWCQDEVVGVLHNSRKVADHRYRLVAVKNEIGEVEKIDLTVDE